MPKQHSIDRLTEELAQYIEDTANFLADAMLEDGVAPFEQRLTEAQRLSYFTNLLYLPDGTPNQEGRQQLLYPDGPDMPAHLEEYTRIVRWTEQRRNREMRGSTRKPVAAGVTEEALDDEDY